MSWDESLRVEIGRELGLSETPWEQMESHARRGADHCSLCDRRMSGPGPRCRKCQEAWDGGDEGPWIISDHAVQRYILRVRPRLTYQQAHAELVEASRVAHFVRPRGPSGDLWRSNRPLRLRLIVNNGVLLTVLPGVDSVDWEVRG